MTSLKSQIKMGIFIIITISVLTVLLPAAENNALWLRYPAISPDGNSIAFSYKGDIFTVPSNGGIPTPLTRHKSYDFKPVWSPDGKNIAFASDRYGNFDIFVIPAHGGKANRLTFHSSGDIPYTFTPDGKAVVFKSRRMDTPESTLFPSGAMSELYQVALSGGLPEQILTTPAEAVDWDSTGTRFLYHDRKGVEDYWRKHHTSSETRDIWLYNAKTKTHSQITFNKAEDRYPIWASDDNSFFFLSERSGSLNIWKANLSHPQKAVQITSHQDHPVRFLSRSDNGDLCYGFNGEIYLLASHSKEAKKIKVIDNLDDSGNSTRVEVINSQATEMALSPKGKEIAFVVRGEVFVTSIDYSLTKRITDTPEQERSVSFSPDGRKLLFAGELGGSWNLYEVSIVSKDEPYFYNSTLLKREPLLVTNKETFQPQYSPDGKEVAFLEERTTLRILNKATGKIRTVLPGNMSYSYEDGDQWYDWSPDGKYLLVDFMDKARWSSEIGLVDASGKNKVINLTNSGYSDFQPRWAMGGKMMIWGSSKRGLRHHADQGAQFDIYAMFFTKEAHERFKLSKAEFELLKKKEDKEKKDKKPKEDKKKKDKKESAKAIKIDLDNIEDRIERLTIHSSDIADALLSPDGETLVYLSKFEKGHDLWINKLREKSTKLLVKLNSRHGHLEFDKEGKHVFVLSQGRILKISIPAGKQKTISYSSEMNLNLVKERAYMFEHAWRQIKKKFYVSNLHGVDWDAYKKNYLRFLPHIDNNWDFAEMLSEMLGELNGSHTGSGYRPNYKNPDDTATLGAFLGSQHKTGGLEILEIIQKGPLDRKTGKIKKGILITAIDGIKLTPGMNYYPLLNRKTGKTVLLTLKDPVTGTEWQEKVKPISQREERALLYERWVDSRRAATEKLSGGRLGYVHIRGMGDGSFREFYSDVFGRYYDKEGLIVDTRFNGGGWLHDELVTTLKGKTYFTFVPRERIIGTDPQNKWTKPSIVIMGEANYSNAHMFPYVYKALGIGKLVGMPVPGTGTAVWWETLQDSTLFFGIPQVGTKGNDGRYLENTQLEPDFQVKNDPGSIAEGRDKQLEKSIQLMLSEIDNIK